MLLKKLFFQNQFLNSRHLALSLLIMLLSACDVSVVESSTPLANQNPSPGDPNPPVVLPLSDRFGVRMSNSWFDNSGACRIGRGDALSCWGKSIISGDGSGSINWSFSPAVVSGFESNVSDVSVGEYDVCAIKAGALYCWGDNFMGETGLGSNDPITSPSQVVVTDVQFSSVKIGPSRQTCALTTLGALYCWGLNDNSISNLGVGSADTFVNVPMPVIGMDTDVTAFSVGKNAICAIKTGAVYCWGSNEVGELGTDSAGFPLSTPTLVPTLDSGVTDLSINSGSFQNSGNSICAIKLGALYCLGQNDLGQLGDNTTSVVTTAEAHPFLSSDVTAIALGSVGGCAIMNSLVYCWGNYVNVANGVVDQNNQSGNRTPIPVTLPLDETFIEVQGNGFTFCARTLSQKEYCWGANLGQALFTDSSTDVATDAMEAGPFD